MVEDHLIQTMTQTDQGYAGKTEKAHGDGWEGKAGMLADAVGMRDVFTAKAQRKA
jgi:hypothetical protein